MTPHPPGYRIVRKLGEGGMGVVYLAEDTTLGRPVAIKAISATLAQDEGARARFLREARMLAEVEHPHVVRIYAFGETDGLPYFVMEYIDGESLADRLRRVERLAPEEALQIVRQVADGLEAAWGRGIVHRDLKPSNILIDTHDVVRVVDFGLAKPVEAVIGELALTRATHILGTLQYMSPEQARDGGVDCRSDIYSLGIVLYEMLTGTQPFRGHPLDILSRQVSSPLPSLRRERADLPSGVLRLVEQMTEKDPSARPQSYATLRALIETSGNAPVAWTEGSPFRGLAAFEFEHAPIFFGRRRAAADVVRALKAQAERGLSFVLVVGKSGGSVCATSDRSVLVHDAPGVRPCRVPGTDGGARAAAAHQPDFVPRRAGAPGGVAVCGGAAPDVRGWSRGGGDASATEPAREADAAETARRPRPRSGLGVAHGTHVWDRRVGVSPVRRPFASDRAHRGGGRDRPHPPASRACPPSRPRRVPRARRRGSRAFPTRRVGTTGPQCSTRVRERRPARRCAGGVRRSAPPHARGLRV